MGGGTSTVAKPAMIVKVENAPKEENIVQAQQSVVSSMEEANQSSDVSSVANDNIATQEEQQTPEQSRSHRHRHHKHKSHKNKKEKHSVHSPDKYKSRHSK